MLALQNHYYGKSESEHRKQVAKDDLKGLFYRNKTTFSLDNYITNMKKINVLDNYNFPYMSITRSGNSLITLIFQRTI